MTQQTQQSMYFDGDSCKVAALLCVGWSRFGEANPYGLSAHDHGSAYELSFMRRGESEWWVDNDTYRIGPGEVFLTKPNELHGGVNDTMHPCELMWLQFDLESSQTPFALPNKLAKEIADELHNVAHRQAKASDSIERHFLRILNALQQGNRNVEIVVNASLQLLLVDVIESLQETASTTDDSSSYSGRIQKTVAWIKSDLSRPLAVGDMAEFAGLKPSQFRNLFKAETGFSPIEYLNNLRVHYAKDLLENTNLSVTAISMEAGFTSSQYFSTCFKRLAGQSPNQFRALSQKTT